MKISTRLALATAVAALGMAVLAGFALFLGHRNTEALEQVNLRNTPQLVQLQKIDLELREIRFRAAGVLLDLMPLQGSINHLKDKRLELASLWSQISQRDMGDTTPETQALRAGIQQGWGTMQAMLTKLEQAYGAKDNKAISAVLEDDWPVAYKDFIKPLQALIPAEEAQAMVIYETAKAENSRLALMSVGLALLCTAGVVAFMIHTMRRLITRLGAEPDALAAAAQHIAQGDLSDDTSTPHPDSVMASMHAMRAALATVVAKVREGVDNVVHTCSEIASGNSDLSGRTEMQASSLQQTTASMAQLTSTVTQNADTAHQANRLATTASDAVAKGGTVVRQVAHTMEAITTSSRKISDIIGVIDGIAFQTNILALNAAVEAARAGEQGRGFAVVASEVRSLAQRSANAAKEIKQLIGESVEKVEAGSRLVGEAGTSMDDIVGQVKRVAELIAEISAASVEQTQGIGQVGTAINQLDQVTQQNAALVEESASAVDSLSQQAAQLVDVVAVFKLAEATPGSLRR